MDRNYLKSHKELDAETQELQTKKVYFFSNFFFEALTFPQRCQDLKFNLQAPVAQKVADEVICRGFQGEGVVFF